MWEEGKYEFIADELIGCGYDRGGDCHTRDCNQSSAQKNLFDFMGNCVIETTGAVFHSVDVSCLFVD